MSSFPSVPSLTRSAALALAPVLIVVIGAVPERAHAACTNGDPADCNPAGTTLNAAAQFVDPTPPVGWAQCAGFIDTAADDVTPDWENNCLPFNGGELFMRVFDMSDTIIAGARLFNGVGCPWGGSHLGYATDMTEGAGFLSHAGVCDGSSGTTLPWYPAGGSFCQCTAPDGMGTRTCNDIFTASLANDAIFYVGADSTSHAYEAAWGAPGGKNSCSLDVATEIHELQIAIYAPDPDTDGDGIASTEDNCPEDPNPMQEDADMDGLGDVCDLCIDDPDNDLDMDMVCGDVDNCPEDPNPMQEDADMDAVGDACDVCPADPDDDVDMDMVCGDVDNCPGAINATQLDADGDGLGDACDACPMDDTNDVDEDGVCGGDDNCPEDANPGQEDTDGNGMGDACDPIAGTGTDGSDSGGGESGGSGGVADDDGSGTGVAETGGVSAGGSGGGGPVTGFTTAGGQPEVSGCACTTDDDRPSGAMFAGLLVLLGLRRRRNPHGLR